MRVRIVVTTDNLGFFKFLQAVKRWCPFLPSASEQALLFEGATYNMLLMIADGAGSNGVLSNFEIAKSGLRKKDLVAWACSAQYLLIIFHFLATVSV
jgi:hypothetical protein